MAEDPAFGGFSTGDAAASFAKVISKIKSDMAAIEASAKNIEASMGKAARHSIGGGADFGAQSSGGGTGFAKQAMGKSSLGAITSQLGGVSGIGRTTAFGIGAAMGGTGMVGGGAIAGGLALAGLPDLIQRPEEAIDRERARFGMAQATGDFGTFQRMLGVAKNDFNVQNMQDFRNTLVYGTQRMGLVGRLGGGQEGEVRAAAQIGGYNTLAGLAGIDQAAVPGVMQSMSSANAFYTSMAAGKMTINPVTGEPIGVEGQINQEWATAGLKGMSQEKALTQIGIDYNPTSGKYQQLLNEAGGNVDAVDMVIEGLRIRARQGGKPLKENQLQDQMKDIGPAGGLGTEKTQADEGVRELEGKREELGAETLDAATAGIEEATKHISNAVQTLIDLEGPMKTMLDAYVTMANQLDTFKTELPGATKGITSFLTGLPGLLLSYLGIKAAAKVLPTAARVVLPRLLPLLANPVTAAVATVAGAGYLSYRASQRDTPEGYQGYLGSPGSPNNASSPTTGARPTSNADGGGAKTVGAHGYAKGDWFVEADQDARIHQGEMILPNRIATAVRQELGVAKTDGGRATEKSGKGNTTVNIYLTVQKASDQEAAVFANRVKRIIDGDRELLAIGAGRFANARD